MYNELKATIKQFINTNNINTLTVGDTNWCTLQTIITNLYGEGISNSEFWADVFFDICYDLKIEVLFD